MAVVACFAIFYITTAFALNYGTATLHIARGTFLSIQLCAILFMALGIILAGWWSDKRDPGSVLITGCVGTILMGLLFGPALGSGALLTIFGILALALFCMGFTYGPLGAYLTALFPVRVRYTGASTAFNLGGIFGGALAPTIALLLVNAAGIGWVGLYMSAAATISLIGLVPLQRSFGARFVTSS
jgi:MFS family permease